MFSTDSQCERSGVLFLSLSLSLSSVGERNKNQLGTARAKGAEGITGLLLRARKSVTTKAILADGRQFRNSNFFLPPSVNASRHKLRADLAHLQILGH